MNIFVGNLNSQTTEKKLETLFSEFGTVKSVKIIMDHFSGRSRGFAFVEMPEKSEAEEAINKLHNTMVDSQSIVVNEAKPRTNNGGGFNNNRRY